MDKSFLGGEDRKKKIYDRIFYSKEPVTATNLAAEMGVSRQIIVGDIALLRASGVDITATSRGYIISAKPSLATARIKVMHNPEDIYDELCTIVDLGARIETEEIESDLYGTILVNINISSREDARTFSEKCMDSSHKALFTITGGVHFHTIKADNEMIIMRVQKALNDKGYFKK